MKINGIGSYEISKFLLSEKFIFQKEKKSQEWLASYLFNRLVFYFNSYDFLKILNLIPDY